jgi:hypothetical protein
MTAGQVVAFVCVFLALIAGVVVFLRWLSRVLS